MKVWTVIIAAVLLFSGMAYGATDCESKYKILVDKLYANTEIADKEKYMPQLKKALQLCEEGKKEEAVKIVDELIQQAIYDVAFENPFRN